MTLAAKDRKALLPKLDRLVGAIEDLLLSGLTTASESTRKALGVTFQEASRMRLLRLGGTLRVANEELGRYTSGHEHFSQRRLSFFLNRAWLLGKGLARAIREKDEESFDRLAWSPDTVPVERVEVVTVGCLKKVAVGTFCAFEFRLRSVGEGAFPAGTPFVWSCVCPLRPGVEIPAEGYLHMPQPQDFTANEFLEKKVLVVENARLAEDEEGRGGRRLTLTKESTVTTGPAFDGWRDLVGWSPGEAVARIRGHEPSPFELPVELQEEVFLDDWTLAPDEEGEDGQRRYPIQHAGLDFEARVSTSVEGESARGALKSLIKAKSRPTLFALLHYEGCQLVLQPLSTLSDASGPDYLTISKKSIDRKALLKTLKFT